MCRHDRVVRLVIAKRGDRVLMTCRHVNEQRDLYLDGDLSPSLTAEVHAHLLQCPACQQQFEMMRACGDLISRDESEPILDSGFASRVVASLPKRSAPPVLMTRRDVRQRFFRIFAGAGLPAAAAMLFLCVLIWPSTSEPEGIVLPAREEATPVTAVDEFVTPMKDVIRDTNNTIQSMTEAVGATVESTDIQLPADATTSQPSLLDAFLSPFKDAMTPPPAEDSKADEEIVRF
jgi:Putative zinc-finger